MMDRAEEYLKRAAEADDLAAATSASPATRRQFFALADQWRDLAHWTAGAASSRPPG
jgi:hypothetical protein